MAKQDTAVRRTTIAAVSVVAGVAGVVSYMHMHELAERAGEGWRAWLVPLAVDGLVVAASMTMVVRRRAGGSAGWLAWVSMIAGVAASLAANVAAAEPSLLARAVAAWPSFAFLLAYELLMDQVKIGAAMVDTAPAVAAASPSPADCREDAAPVVAVPLATEGPAGGPARQWQAVGMTDETTLTSLGTIGPARIYVADAVPSDGDPEAARQGARQHYREVLTAGGSLTGKELADLYGKSERWGRDQIRAVRDQLGLAGAGAR